MGVLKAALLITTLACASTARAEVDAPPPPAPEENWATKRARSLTEQGELAERAGQTDTAVRRYLEAIELDGTFGPAYLALARLRTSTGEVDEAEKALDLGMDRIMGFWEGLLAKAELMARTKRFDAATELFLDYLRAKPDDEAALHRVVDVATKADRLPVALAAARRLYALATAAGDETERRNAASTVRVLMRLLGAVDPVVGAVASTDRARRALARFRPR